MDANGLRMSILSKRASKQSLKYNQLKNTTGKANNNNSQMFNTDGQEIEIQSVISGMLNSQLQERSKLSIMSNQGEGVMNIPDLISVRRKASLLVTDRRKSKFEIPSNKQAFSVRNSRRSITSANGKEKNNLETVSQMVKKDQNLIGSGTVFKPRISTHPNFTFNRKSKGSLNKSPTKSVIDVPYLNIESNSSPLENKRKTHNYPYSQDNSPNKQLGSDNPFSPSIFLSKRDRSTKSFHIKNKPRLTTTIEKEESKSEKAYKYFNDIKTSISIFENEHTESGGHGKLLGMGKDVLLDKYIKRQTSHSFNIQHELNSLDKLKSHPNISKTRLSKLKSNKEVNEERRTSMGNTDSNLISNNSENTKLPPNLETIKVKETNRKLQKVTKVVDSLSDDDGNLLELMLQHEASNLTIDPNSTLKRTWDFVLTAITAYALIFTPYYIAFIDDDIPFINILEIVFDIFFILDIILNFFVGYYNSEEELILSLYLIAKNYIFGWLFLDVLASIPGSLILYIMDPSHSSSGSKSLTTINKATRFTKLYRMVKFTKLVKIFKLSKDEQKTVKLVGVEEMNLSSAVQRFIQFILTFIVVSHMLSCVWIFIGKTYNPNWIEAISSQDISNGSLYVASLYFHWTTIFTVGYGDILSTNRIERAYNCVLMFVGILIYSFAVSSMGTILTSYDSITSQYYKKLEVVENLSLEYKLPDYFYNKLTKYLKYNFQFNKNERLTFINELPKKSRSELLNDMYKDIITNFNFLNGCSKDFISRIVFSMRPMKVFRKENLIMEGEYIEEVIFVRKGTLGVHLGSKNNGVKIMEIRRNEHFGDVLIISKTKSPVCIKVSSKFADLLIIRKHEFLAISKEFPEEFEDAVLLSAYNFLVMLEIAEQKKTKLGYVSPVKSINEVISDEVSESTLFDVFEEEDKQTKLEMIEEENPLEESEEKEKDTTPPNNYTNDNPLPFNEPKRAGDSFLTKSIETLKNLSLRKSNDKLLKKNTFNVNFIIHNNNFISGEATNRSNRSKPNSVKSEGKTNKKKKGKDNKNIAEDTLVIKEEYRPNEEDHSNKKNSSRSINSKSSNSSSKSRSNSKTISKSSNSFSNSKSNSKSSSSSKSPNSSLSNKYSNSATSKNNQNLNAQYDYRINKQEENISKNIITNLNPTNSSNNYILNKLKTFHRKDNFKNVKQIQNKFRKCSIESDSDSNSIPFSDGDAIDQEINNRLPKRKNIKVRTTLALQLSNKLLNKIQNPEKKHKNKIVKQKLKTVLEFNQKDLSRPMKRYSDSIQNNFNLANVASMLRKRDEEKKEREEEQELYFDSSNANKNKFRKMQTQIPKDYEQLANIEREMVKKTEEQNKKLERFVKRVSVKFKLDSDHPIFNV